tara:strand:- start:6739 stop:7113 length:375 start_codon:yes stop_codon:yes gene_type:complete
MQYTYSPEWTAIALNLSRQLELEYIDLDRVVVIESQGSKTKRTIARIHALGKVMQLGMGQKAFYTIELITERFNKMSKEEKIKTIIHELMHIPASFGGGFRHHKIHVTSRTVETAFERIKHLYT